jgi:hypothetical protein
MDAGRIVNVIFLQDGGIDATFCLKSALSTVPTMVELSVPCVRIDTRDRTTLFKDMNVISLLGV